MGHDITYCSICQERIRWQDIQGGQAFKVETQTFCLKCAPEAIKSLPKARVKAMFQTLATPEKPIPTTTPPRGISTATPRPQRAPELAERRTSRNWVPWALGTGAALLVLVLILAFGRSESPSPDLPPAPPTPLPKAAVIAAPPPSPTLPKEGPAPRVEPPAPPASPAPSRDAKAKEAFDKACEWALANPSDMDGAIRRFQDACFLSTGTPTYEPAKKELELYRKRQREFFAGELAPFDEEAKSACAQERFMKALDIMGKAAQRHPSTEWQLIVSKRVREINDEIIRLLDTVKQNALDARSKGDEAKVKALRERVAGWGSAQVIQEFRAALDE